MFKDYQLFEARPAVTAREGVDKLNAVLLVHNSVNAKVLTREVDYVSVLVGLEMEMEPLLVCLWYVNPINKRVGLNKCVELTLRDLEKAEDM